MGNLVDVMVYLIVITGGPCGGKSSILSVAKQYLEDRGFLVFSLAEVATELISAGFHPVNGWEDNLDFQRALLRYIVYRRELYTWMAKRQKTNKPVVILCDRAELDALAYVGRDNFLQVVEELNLDLHEMREQYKAVIHMVTAADGAEPHYTLENNTARSETPENARALDKKLIKAWDGHQRHFIIGNSTDFSGKIHRALTKFTRVLGMPDPLEQERRFVFRNFRMELIPEGTVAVRLIQDYLVRKDPNVERRVRQRILDGSSSYYYTEKQKTDRPGVCPEKEPQITLREYERYLREERDPECGTIEKVRHNVLFQNRVLQVNVYSRPLIEPVILEEEVDDMDAPLIFPVEWDLVEVTEDEAYDNYNIAKGSLSRTT